MNNWFILKQDLVKKLYPYSVSITSGLQLLRREINQNPELKKRIKAVGSTRKHSYNKKQLEIILENFGLTLEEFEQL